MKPFQSTKKIIFLAFLLSLLFHFGSIVYVSSFAEATADRAMEDTSSDKQKINKQRDEWIEAKARAGNFGTPVFFSSFAEAEFTLSPVEGADTADDPQATTNTQDKHIEEKTDKPEETVQPEKIIPQEKEPILPISQPTSMAIEPEIKPLPRKEASQPKQHSQIKKPLSAPKPPITLAQLTQGFLNHVKNEGNHAIHMLGKKSGTPSDEQMKYERYLQKLSWCLQNSFNIYNDRFPTSAKRDDTAQVLLSLNKDGTMRQCHVSKTSGSRDLDQFIIFIFNDASSSFPPVPHYLPHDPFTINYVVMVSTSEENRWKLYRQ